MRVAHWPYCPHDPVTHFAAVDDVVLGGPRLFEHLGEQPVWIETTTQLKREMKARNLRIREQGER
jgi:hypothetical protein